MILPPLLPARYSVCMISACAVRAVLSLSLSRPWCILYPGRRHIIYPLDRFIALCTLARLVFLDY